MAENSSVAAATVPRGISTSGGEEFAKLGGSGGAVRGFDSVQHVHGDLPNKAVGALSVAEVVEGRHSVLGIDLGCRPVKLDLGGPAPVGLFVQA